MFINFSEKGSYHEKQYSVSSVLRNRKKKKIMQDSERKMLKNRAHCLTTPLSGYCKQPRFQGA